ncbi:MAG: hypothetical protein IJX50_01455 [Clostridia bacterium]|nr:hypothetical protein [Clostridia bacterium]
MHLPIIKGGSRYKKSTTYFGGINMLQDYSEGELCECSGISHLNFPAITQRQKSETVFECNSPSAMIFGRKECIAAEGELYYDRKKVATLTPGRKNLAILGDKIAVFPDKIFYDTKTGETGNLEGECKSIEGITVTFTKNSITVPTVHSEEKVAVEMLTLPKNTNVFTYSTVTCQDAEYTFSGFKLMKVQELTPNVIFREKCEKNQYRRVVSISEDEKTGNFLVDNELVTVNNCMENFFSQLKSGDVVEISGCKILQGNNKTAQIVAASASALWFSNETFTEVQETAVITIKRKIPDFSCVCSYENRLWGCEGNTIYASALGDMTNFFVYKNLSTDSFSVMSNSAGDFTACVPFGNCCLFFKENGCFKLYGNRPSNFQLTESYGGGVLATDSKSIVSTGGRIIYKGSGGIYTFYGGVPQCISQKLTGITMDNAVSGSDGKRFYISADTEEGREEFVWDMERNLWSKSGVRDIIGYSSYGGNLYRLHPHGVEKLLEETDDEAQWSITLCPFDEDYYKTKNYTRLYISVHLFENAYINTQVSCDNGPWQDVHTCYADEKKYLNIPCVIKSCHSVKLRLSGKGKCLLESITREFSVN